VDSTLRYWLVSCDLLLFGPFFEQLRSDTTHIIHIDIHPDFFRFLQTGKLQTPSKQSSDTFTSFTTKRPQTLLNIFASSEYCSHHMILNHVFIANHLERRSPSWKCPEGCREADLVLSTRCSHPSPSIRARGALGSGGGSGFDL
jgi:hypothetical protein